MKILAQGQFSLKALLPLFQLFGLIACSCLLRKINNLDFLMKRWHRYLYMVFVAFLPIMNQFSDAPDNNWMVFVITDSRVALKYITII